MLAFYMVLGSAVLWAMQPAFILIVGAAQANAPYFLVLNKLATLAVACVWFARPSRRQSLAPVLKDRAVLVDVFRFCAVDAVLIALSYYLLMRAGEGQKLASSALVFEAWPVVATVLLFVFLPRAGDRGGSILLSIALLVAGFIVLHSDSFGQLHSIGALESAASAVVFGTAVATIQGLVRRHPILTGPDTFVFVILVRASLTWVVFTLGSLVQYGWPDLNSFDLGVIALSLAFGILVFTTSVLYHRGMALARSNSLALITLISPLLAPIFIFLMGYGAPGVVFLAGGAVIFCGIAIASRPGDISAQFQVLLVATVITGIAVLFWDGRDPGHGFQYVDTLAVFYGLVQSSSFARLQARYVRFCSKIIAYRHAAGSEQRARRALLKDEIRFAAEDTVALSELILMSVLATGTVMASLIAREYGFIPDISTLLICVTAVFLLTLCWTYQIRIMNLRLAFREAGRRVDYRTRLARRMASYALFFIIFAWFFALIAAKHGLF